MRRLTDEIRHAHLVDLIKRGVVPLDNLAQIDGVLDHEKPQDRLPRLKEIETACRKRGDEKALAAIARWRLGRQSER
jgi:hypothetical protein